MHTTRNCANTVELEMTDKSELQSLARFWLKFFPEEIIEQFQDYKERV